MEREKRITLTNTELNAFRRSLENRQIELGSGNRDRDALAIEMSADALDRIQQASDRDYAISNLERNSNRLRDVRTALRRIDAGTFGICVGCKDNINPKCRAAVPWASFCIVCQEAADHEQKTSPSEIRTSLLMVA